MCIRERVVFGFQDFFFLSYGASRHLEQNPDSSLSDIFGDSHLQEPRILFPSAAHGKGRREKLVRDYLRNPSNSFATNLREREHNVTLPSEK